MNWIIRNIKSISFKKRPTTKMNKYCEASDGRSQKNVKNITEYPASGQANITSLDSRSEKMIRNVMGMKKSLNSELGKGDDYDPARTLDILNQLMCHPIDLRILRKTLVGTIVSKFKHNANSDLSSTSKSILKKWRKLAKDGGVPSSKSSHGQENDKACSISLKEKEQNVQKIPQSSTEVSQGKVVNVKVAYIRPRYHNLLDWTADPNNIYIGRGGVVFVNRQITNDDGTKTTKKERFPKKDSPFANPFKVTKSLSRDDSIKMFSKQMMKKLAANPELRSELRALYGKTLGCWCKPNDCHGDVLLEIINQIQGEYRSSERR